MVLHARKFYVTLSQRYALAEFPFDMQVLQILFRPKDHQRLVVLKRMFEPRFKNSISPMVSKGAHDLYPTARHDCLMP